MSSSFHVERDTPLSIGGAMSAGDTMNSLAAQDSPLKMPDVPIEDSGIHANLPFMGPYDTEKPKPSLVDTLSAAWKGSEWFKGLENEKRQNFGPDRKVLWDRPEGMSDADAAEAMVQSVNNQKGEPDSPIPYNVFTDPKVAFLPPSALAHLDGIHSPQQLETFIHQHYAEQERMKTLADSGAIGVFAQLAVGAADPTGMPLFAPVSGGRIARSLQTARYGLLANTMGAMSGYHNSTDETVYDTLSHIANGTLIAGAMGFAFSHDSVKMAKDAKSRYDMLDALEKKGDDLRARFDELDAPDAQSIAGNGRADLGDSTRSFKGESFHGLMNALEDFRYNGEMTSEEYAAAIRKLDLIPDAFFNEAGFEIYNNNIPGKTSGTIGTYNPAYDLIRASVGVARTAGRGVDQFGDTLVHELFHRGLNFSLAAERAAWLKIWRMDPVADPRTRYDASAKDFADYEAKSAENSSSIDGWKDARDTLKYDLNPNEAWANFGTKFVNDVLNGRYVIGSAKDGVTGYFDRLFQNAKRKIGLLPRQMQEDAANEFFDLYLQRLRRDSATLPDVDRRIQIMKQFDMHGRNMMVRLLTDATSEYRGSERAKDHIKYMEGSQAAHEQAYLDDIVAHTGAADPDSARNYIIDNFKTDPKAEQFFKRAISLKDSGDSLVILRDFLESKDGATFVDKHGFHDFLTGKANDKIPFENISGEAPTAEMRVGDAVKRVNEWLDSDTLVRKTTSIAATGLGLEKWNWSPWHWVQGSVSDTIRNLGERLVASPGLKLAKNMASDANGNPQVQEPTIRAVTTNIAINWKPKLVEATRALKEGWIESRGYDPKSPGMSTLKIGIADGLSTPASTKLGMSFDEFKGEVATAMFNNDAHSNPHVQAAAQKIRPILDEVGQAAADHGVFSWEQRRYLRELTADFEREAGIRRSEGFGLTEDREVHVTDNLLTQRAMDIRDKISKVEAEIKRIDGGGWKTDGRVPGESWFPKWIDRQTVMRNLPEYENIVRSYFKSRGIIGDDLEKAVSNHIDGIMTRKSYIDLYDDPVNAPRSAKARQWDMPAQDIMKFIDTDVERVLNRYIGQMGAGIEMSKMFDGHLDLKPMMDKAKLNYDAALKEAGGTVEAMERLSKEWDQDHKSILAMRDMIYGVHNLPSDPDAIMSRTIRSFKIVNAMTLLGGAVLSELSSIARPVMTDGLEKTMKYGVKAFMMDKQLWALQQAELHAANVANDIWLHTRAMSFSDWNQIYYNGTKLEQGIEKMGNAFTILSGLSHWTDYAKTVAGTVIGNRILDDCLLLADGKLSPKAAEDLARGGIGKAQAAAIAEMVRTHGDMLTKEGWLSDAVSKANPLTLEDGAIMANLDKQISANHFDTYLASMREKGGSLLANADAWTNAEARMAFRGALYEDVNRAIHTPGISDKPLWMSTELGGLLGQFKSFGMSTMQRTLMAGLQDGDRKFWGGMALMTAGGMFSDALKDAIQRGEDWRERHWQDKIVSGMDRAGVIGSFGDINNMISRLTENQIGLDALMGDSERKYTSGISKIGALGPSFQQVARAAAMVGDLGRGDFGEAGYNFRRIAPLMGLWYLQPGINLLTNSGHIYGDGGPDNGPSYGVGSGPVFGVGVQPPNQVH